MKLIRSTFLRAFLSCALTLPHTGMANTSVSATMLSFQLARFEGEPLSQTLRREIADHYEEARIVLTAAIGSQPGKVAEIVRIAVDEGVLADDIAAQCDTMMNQHQLEALIRVSLSERIDAVPIIRRCLAYMPYSQLSDLLALAINNSTPGQIERVMEAAYIALADDIADPFSMVKEGILRSNAFTVEGIEHAEEIDSLITEIQLQDVLEVVVSEEGTDVDQIADVDAPPPEPGDGGSVGGNAGGDGVEPPFSDS